MNMYEHFKKDKVEASSVADFLSKYYKGDRYIGRGKEYAATLLESYENDVKENGYCIISSHDSVLGKIVSYYQN